MTLLQSWCNNLELLRPKNLKLLFLIAMKLVKDNAYVFVLLAINYGLLSFYLVRLHNDFLNRFLPVIFINGTLFTMVLYLRSSVGKKNIRYAYSYFTRVWPAVVFSFISTWIMDLLVPLTRAVRFLKEREMFSLSSLAVGSLFIVLFFLFFIDERSSGIMSFFASIYRAIKMCIYNAPIFGTTLFIAFSAMAIPVLLLLGVFICFPRFGDLYPFSILLVAALGLVEVVFWYMYITLIVTIYNKLIYDQRSLYWND